VMIHLRREYRAKAANEADDDSEARAFVGNTERPRLTPARLPDIVEREREQRGDSNQA
jgi:hypothetical protein